MLFREDFTWPLTNLYRDYLTNYLYQNCLHSEGKLTPSDPPASPGNYLIKEQKVSGINQISEDLHMLRKPGVGTVNALPRSPFWLTPIPPILLPAAMSVSHRKLPAAPFLPLTTAVGRRGAASGEVNHAHLPVTA